MPIKYLIVLFAIICFGCKRHSARVVRVEYNSGAHADTIPLIKEVEKACKMIDALPGIEINEMQIKEHFYNDSTVIKTYSDNGELRKLTYTSFDDGGFIEDTCEDYFLEKYIVSRNGKRSANEKVCVYLRNHKIFMYSIKGSELKLDPVPEPLTQKRFEGVFSYEISRYLQFFPKVHFNVLPPADDTDISVSSGVNLITYINADLHKYPNMNSPFLRTLKPHTLIIYLGATRLPDVVNGKRWIWYKVRTTDGDTGWIFGYPEIVDEINDEFGE